MLREQFSLEQMKEILCKYDLNSIKISSHYLRYLSEGKRDIGEKYIKEALFDKEFYFVEKQINSWIRYKLVFELSSKYDLVIVVKEE